MQRKPVHSSTFLSLGYDPAHQILEAQFRDGDVYRYFDVPPSLWRQMTGAVSKGKFFASHIRDRYKFLKQK